MPTKSSFTYAMFLAEIPVDFAVRLGCLYGSEILILEEAIGQEVSLETFEMFPDN